MKTAVHITTVILALAWLAGGGHAQRKDYILETISLEHGLSQSVVETILQDHNGFLWFGTQDGLNFYNGYGFKVFKNDPYKPASLSQNYVTALYEDFRHTIWIGTERGLNFYRDGEVRRWAPRHDSTAWLDANFSAIIGDSAGILWMATIGKGLMRLDTRTDELTVFTNNPDDPYSLVHNSVRALYKDGKGVLWIGSTGGLSRLDGGTFTNFATTTSGRRLPETSVLAIHPAGHDRLWVGTATDGLWLITTPSMVYTAWRHDQNDPGSIPSDVIQCLYTDSHGSLWVGTESAGVGILTDGRFTTYQHDPANPFSLGHNDVQNIYEDHSGNVWVGTLGGGITKFRKTYFKLYSPRSAPERRLPGSEVWASLLDRSGRLWVGVHGVGVCLLEGGRVQIFKPEPGNPRALSDNKVMCFFEDPSGRIWAGTTNGLNVFDGTGWEVMRRNPADPSSLPNNYINHIMLDSRQRLWIATFGGGLCQYLDGRFVVYQNIPHDETSISSNDVFRLAEDQQGNLWIGTFNGLNRFDGKSFTRFNKNPSDHESLSQNTILSLAAGSDGSIWIGTDGGGLDRYKDGRFTAYMEKDGLPSNLIYGIIEDSDRLIWVSTNAGLCRFNPQDTGRTRFRRFDTKDGLLSNEFNQGGYFKSAAGELFFGSIKGLVRFHPRDLVPRVFTPPVFITAFKKFDVEVAFPFEVTNLDCVEISYRDNFFAFEFAALDYTVPEKNQYAYRLEGFDHDWIFSGSRRYASYTNLDGGTYRFQLKAANSDGVWNEKPTSVTVIIRPPFWKTWWFMGSAVVLVAGLAAGFYSSRIRIMKHRNIVLEQKVRERTTMIEDKNRELESKNEQIRQQQDQLIQSEKLSSLGRLVSGMSHEINNPLNFTYGNAVNMELELEDLYKEIRQVLPSHLPLEGLNAKFNEMGDMLKTIKMGTERIKDIVVGLRDFAIMYDSETTDIQINTLVDYLIGILRSQERNNVEIVREYQEVPPIRGLYGQLSHAVMNILRNAVEAAQTNAATTGGARVVIRTYVHEDRIVLSIRDNGEGIREDVRYKIFEPFFTTKEVGQGTGLGLSISYGIIRNHKGEITFTSEAGAGTEFRIELPMGQAQEASGSGNLT